MGTSLNKAEESKTKTAVDHKAKETPTSSGDDNELNSEQAVALLCKELDYLEDRARDFVKRRFEHNNGQLLEGEFNGFMGKVEKTKRDIVPLFKNYDRDGSGYVTFDDASNMLRIEPFNFPLSNIDQLLRKFDTNGNKTLKVEKFCNFYAAVEASYEVLSRQEVIQVIRDMSGEDNGESPNETEFMQLWVNRFGGRLQ